MELVSSIQRSSRGKGAGFAWTVEINTPSVIGTVDAHAIAMVASTEVVNAIRANWRAGRDVSGRTKPTTPTGRNYRRVALRVIESAPSFDDYQAFASTLEDRQILTISHGRSYRGRERVGFVRRFRPQRENYTKFVNNIKRNYRATAPSGEVGVKGVRSTWYPYNDVMVALNGSGLMADTLRGKARTARKAPVGGKNKRSVASNAHVELRVPKSRQNTAGWKGGLTQPSIDGLTRTFANMPQTERAMETAIGWANLGRISTDVFVAFRIFRLVAGVVL